MASSLVIAQHGKPEISLQLQDQAPTEELKPHEVRLAMACAPINPADLNSIEGQYGRSLTLPTIAGHEGVGWVSEVGSEVTHLRPGDLALPLIGQSCWCTDLVLTQEKCHLLPPDLDPLQACMLRVNPATAALLLDHLPKTSGQSPWIALNAANSGVGQAMIALARMRGVRTLGLVRREEQRAQILAWGADAAVLDNDTGLDEARQILGGDPLMLAANAVGGDSALRLLEILHPGGEMITYGAMGRRSLKVPNRLLIFKGVRLSGLWISRWYQTQTRETVATLLNNLAMAMQSGLLRTDIDSVYPLADFQAAIRRAQESGRHGKVLLDLGLPKADRPAFPH